MDICINVSTGPPKPSYPKKKSSRLSNNESTDKKPLLNNNNSAGGKIRKKYLPQRPVDSTKCIKLTHPKAADTETKTNDNQDDVSDDKKKNFSSPTNSSKRSDSTKINLQSNSYKSAGKISSLFGNNPDVPNIGQRLVKPVSESVFTKKNFDDLDIHPFMISNLKQNMQITNMTTVQQKAIPQILSGKDILVRSQTGSGKTLTYALPIVEFLHKIRPKLMRDSGLKALIIVPTRELALQTYECFLKLIKSFTWIVPGYLVGGEKRKAEKARLRRGCTILVATPGRLLDHIKHTEALKLKDVKYFVLDEADRMLDMGYEKDISEIVSALKIADGNPESNGYDPLAILRQNKKTVFNDADEDNDDNVNDKEEEEEKKTESKNNKVEEKETPENNEEKKEYHSGTDSDDETQEMPMRSKKLIKKTQQAVEEEKTETESSEVTKEKSGRQTVLLSATLTNAVEKLAGLTMTNPIFIDAAEDNLKNVGGNLGDINEDLVVPQSVIQSYVVTPPKLRMVTLSAYIAGKCQDSGQHKMLVFVATQDMVDYYTEIMSSVLGEPQNADDEDSDPLVDVEFFKLHGSMTQKDRTDVFKTFRNAKSGVLFCTDVAARGLDMPKVDTVIQYTGPLSARDYVHRIGRTARAGSAGTAIIFLTPPEIEFIRMLESRRIRIKQENMDDILDKLMGPLSRQHTVQAAATDLQNKFENLIIDNKKFHDKACRAYVSWVRFYSSYPRDMREIFNRKDLHLGHYAKSFALRDPPQKIGGIGKTLRETNSSKEHNNRLSNERPSKRPIDQQKQQQQQSRGSGISGNKSHLLKRSRMLNVSEYGDGLEPTKKSKKN